MKLTAQEYQLLIKGDELTTLSFYNQIQPVLDRFFERRVSNCQDCEELVQDTIISILDSLPQYKQEAAFSTWCYSIARHELIDYYRRKKIKSLIFSHFPFLKDIVDKALGPQLKLEEKELKHRIYLTFSQLNEGYSQILRLRYIESMSVAKIAATLGISYKAAESRLSRARLAFQKKFVYRPIFASAAD
jgi:RNA polymerase sigma-70 factor, ECF subfamily